MKPDVTVIIVNYNTKELLRNCLTSLLKKTQDINIEVIVSDNGSVDGSIDMVRTLFPQIILITNNKNIGFGKANNQALKIAKGKYIFYLNSDTELKNNAIKYFIDYWQLHENESLGALGSNLLDENNKYMHSFSTFPTYKKLIFEPIKFLFTSYIKSIIIIILRRIPKNIKINKEFKKYIGDVGYITGADLFLLNNYEAAFDERFFMYYEDCDLELRLAKKGKRRVIIDGPEIFHLENGSDKNKKGYSLSNIYNEISRIKYYRKHMDLQIFIPIIKIIVLLTWINPFIYKKSKSYIKEYIKS